jgi:proteasome lid subunit RPN8/RPN11
MSTNKFEVVISAHIKDKIMHWIRKADNEVSGFGTVEHDEKANTFTIKEVWLLNQEVGAAHTDIDEKSLAKLMYETRDKGDLRWWWHSHVDMSVFWSPQDRETIKELGANGWIVASVFNTKEEVRSALCYQYDYQSSFGKGKETAFHDEINTTWMMHVDADELAAWDKEFDEKVKEKPTVVTMPHGAHYDPSTGVSHYPPSDRGALPRSPNGGRTIITDPGEDERDPYDYDLNPGLLSYGVKAEAEALGMSVVAYVNILESRWMSRIMDLEDQLEILERQGKIRGVPFGHINA